MGVHTHDDKKEKKSENIQKRYFFKEDIRILLLSVGVQSANSEKRKTVCRVVLFGCRNFFSWKTYFEWFGKNYQRDYSGML